MHPDDRPRQRGPGRHRDPRRSFGPIALAVLVALMLGGLGAGAAFLPESFVGGNDQAGQGGAAGTGTTLSGAEGAGEWPAADAYPAGTPPTPSAKPSPTRTAKPKPSPTKSTAKPTRTATRTPTTGPANMSELEKVVAIVNQERAGGDCPAVKVNTKLARAAQLHSEDQAEHDKMSHDGSDGSTPWQRSERAGYKNAIGENVAMGYRDAEAVMEGWMNSPGHRNNIMNCSARAIGMGLARSSDGSPYWTQMFGSVA